MKLGAVVAAMMVVGSVAVAQAPKAEPMGNLAQVMRGILFPNSNILFDVQSVDPDNPPKTDQSTGGGATSAFSGIYKGWPVVENAAIALGESATLLTIPGRLCENGRPVPLKQADWAQFTRELKDASQKMLKAARSRNRETASDATNDVAGACENCHLKYRDVGDKPRCTP
ncbi:MAG: hypothetical protein ACT4QD_11780 [Acidobacteriota bacterium]